MSATGGTGSYTYTVLMKNVKRESKDLFIVFIYSLMAVNILGHILPGFFANRINLLFMTATMYV